MIQVDTHSIVTLLLAVALAVLGLEMIFKHIPENEEFKKLKTIKSYISATYLVAAVYAGFEFFFWKSYESSTVIFLNLSCCAYQFVLCTAAITTCFNPSFTDKNRIVKWLGLTTLWAVPLGVATYFDKTWAVYAIYIAYILQISWGGLLFFRNYNDGVSLIQVADFKKQVNLRWLKTGTYYVAAYVVLVAVVSGLPSWAHNAFAILTLIFYIWFATRFTSFADRFSREYYMVLTEAGLTDTKPEQVDHYKEREELCRKAVDAWVERKGFCDPDPDRDSAAEKIGLDKEELRWYFTVCLKEDFRSWRIRLRIEEAKEILTANPDAPINELAKTLGFNTRSNFFTYFKKYTGEQTTEFIARIHKK